MVDLKEIRRTLGLSQSKLARLSTVSRFKICTFELGGGSLSNEELQQIRQALQQEADRLRRLSSALNSSQYDMSGPK